MIVRPTRILGLLIPLALSISAALPTGAQIIYQSAGAPDFQGGTGFSTAAWAGVRFTTPQAYNIGSITYNLRGTGTIFLAINSIADINSFPTSDLSGAVFERNFTPTSSISPADQVLQTNFVLPAGSYSLLVGAGEFGATGDGVTGHATSFPGTSYLYANPSSPSNAHFQNPGDMGARVLLAATPEPGSIALLFSTALCVSTLLWKRRRA